MCQSRAKRISEHQLKLTYKPSGLTVCWGGDSVRSAEVYTSVGSVLRQRHRPGRRRRAPGVAPGRDGRGAAAVLPQLQGDVVQAVLVASRHVSAHPAAYGRRRGRGRSACPGLEAWGLGGVWVSETLHGHPHAVEGGRARPSVEMESTEDIPIRLMMQSFCYDIALQCILIPI